ncbi:MAG TPA: suppressor of fused domain protein [Jatrophihabitans sp.]
MADPALLALLDAALADHFGHRPSRASVSFVGVDPIEILRFEPVPGERAYVSLGMSSLPMTPADSFELSNAGPRAELALFVRDEIDRFTEVWRKFAVLAAGPAVEGVVYTDGMTVDLGEALAPRSACTGVLVRTSSIPPAEGVDFLEVVPALSNELAWARVHGGAELAQRWVGHGTDLLDLTRAAVDLS